MTNEDEIGRMVYFLRSQAEAVGKLWESREFSADDIEEVQRAIVALGDIVRVNRRAAA